MTDCFDWNTDDSVVLPEQQAVAVYANVRGDIVIRQENPVGVDSLVCIRPHYALNICRAILREAGLHSARIVELAFDENELVGRDGNLMHIPREVLEKFDADGNLIGGAPKDPTAAARKRRQRQRERDTAADNVTDRDSHDVTTEPLLKLAHG